MNEMDKRKYLSKIPDILKDNKDFNVFLELSIDEFNIDLANIEHFTDLIDPDKVPTQFIEALGSVIGYENVLNADESFQREILQRMHTIYSQRGTDKSIIMSATHGSNEGWVGGEIFIPGYSIGNENAKIVFTTDKIFTHCRSSYSGGDVFSDSNMYRSGVILLTVPYIDDKIRKALDKNIPAGVKYYFVLEMRLDPDEEHNGEFGEYSCFNEFKVVAITEEEKLKKVQEKSNGILELNLTMADDKLNILVHSKPCEGKPNHSGSLEVGFSNDNEYTAGVSALSVTTLKKPFLKGTSNGKDYVKSETGEYLDVKNKNNALHITRDIDLVDAFDMQFEQQNRIIPKRSCFSSTRGTKHTLSGLLTGHTDTRVQYINIYPNQVLYNVYYVENLRPPKYHGYDYIGSHLSEDTLENFALTEYVNE